MPDHFRKVNTLTGDHCGNRLCLYPWPCPGELAARAAAVRALHPATGYCAVCCDTAPCPTRCAIDGQRAPVAVSR